ncbi:VPLPA-CTERM sorting domain-containing protein [Pseudotabrizicola formosa]|uniref:VPLPA-CTERM sorting domain-containing protein n=1 Tax=Pseudotabrizicola formosa TaxID=2030009 RepID=UPI000CD07116|nr:VPLPA-CTERM sorting domain-containing protein [Pseudotabrizicola formosa]
MSAFLSRFIRPLVASGLALVLSLGVASAATVTYSTTLPGMASLNLIANGTLGGSAVLDENVTGSILNQRTSPWAAANSTLDPLAATSVYSAIRSTTADPASAYFDFGTVMRRLSFVWGTPGVLNRAELFLGGVSQLVLTGAVPQAQTGVLSVFTEVTGVRFDRLVFSAGKPALEYANLTVAAVPLPAGLPLLAGALFGLGLLRRRRAQAA